jgi:UDP-glucose-4-epimerase GalE
VNPYGETKLMIERALHWYGECHGFRWAAPRYFNACGAHPDGKIGEVHEPETHLIPLVLQAALGTRENVGVFGKDYPTPDGTAIRDYIHVMDLASAHIRALEYLQQGGASGAFNLGTGKGLSVKEVIEATERVTGRTVPVRDCPRRAGDPPELVADASRAFQMLNWKPAYSDIDTIIETAWRWETSKS